jgi:hypothetical protein
VDEGEFIRVKRKDGIASFSALCDDPGPARLFVDSRRDGAAVAGGNGGDFKVIASGADDCGPTVNGRGPIIAGFAVDAGSASSAGDPPLNVAPLRTKTSWFLEAPPLT